MTTPTCPQTASGQNNPPRKVYERPVIIPLGELVKGSGNCTNGSNPTAGGGNCKEGGNAGINNCINGGSPSQNCNQGGTKGNPGILNSPAL